MARNWRNKQGRPQERSLLISGQNSTSYGTAGPAPGRQPPPPYSTTPGCSGGGYEEIHASRRYEEIHTARRRRDLSPLRPVLITKGRIAGTAILLVFVAQLVAFVFFYDLPTKIGRYNEAMARMRVREDAMRDEAKHLEGERVALRRESTRLEEEREALESSTQKMHGERQALESAIRHSEQERSRLEKQTHLVEGERRLLREEELALQEERKKWERAREDRVPQGAFWEAVQPKLDCLSYGKREYWGTLRNIPEGWTELDACMNMPVEIKGVSVRRPDRCLSAGGSPIRAFWTVDWDQPDCKPWHQDFYDKVSWTTITVASLHSTWLTCSRS